MLRYFTDENFNNDITRGLRIREPHLDILRIQETEIVGAEDPDVLAWAARNDRVILTHDRATMPGFAYARISNGDPMRGLFVLNDRMPVRQAIEELSLISECSEPAESDAMVVFLPL